MELIIKRVSERKNMPKNIVKHVHNHLMYSIVEVMRSGTHRNILLQGFGKFIVKPKRKEILDKIIKHGVKNNRADSTVEQNISEMDVLEI